MIGVRLREIRNFQCPPASPEIELPLAIREEGHGTPSDEISRESRCCPSVIRGIARSQGGFDRRRPPHPTR